MVVALSCRWAKLLRTEKTARPKTRLTHMQRLLAHLDVLALLVGEVAEAR
jgi:hypothetical protein